MKVHRLDREQFVPRPPAEVFAFFAQARNLEQLTPAFLRFQVLTPGPIEMRAGALIHYRLRVHGVPIRWVTQIEAWEHERTFVDRQLSGPYRLWHHRHDFEARDGGTVVRDQVHYSIGFGPLGELVHSAIVKRDLEQIFGYRHAAVQRLLG